MNGMRKLFLLLVICLPASVNHLLAQVDAHFTQYYAYPLWLNPAMTGIMDGNYRITANLRRQLPSVNSPLNTQGITADMALANNFGIGFTALNQTTSDGGYHYNNGYLSLSYQVHLTKYQVISSGFQLGIVNRRVDPAKFQFGNQYNPAMGYDPSLPSNELFAHQSVSSFDGSIGLVYFDGNPLKSFNPFIGISLYHPTEPNSRFLSGTNDNKIPMRYAVHGGVRLKMSERVELVPHVIYLRQGNVSELTGGLAMNLAIDGDKDLLVGSTYRLNDAVAPNIGLHFNGLTIGLSYDINISQLKTAASSNGGYELSISFTNQKKTPDAKFICPRL
ncbi:MAG: hypothetical protein NVSMB63_06390 [Sediminibacterium sp.]